MNFWKRIYCRVYQKILWFFINFLKIKEPIVIAGENKVLAITDIVKNKKLCRVLIVTDKNIVRLGLLNDLLASLEKNKIITVIYQDVVPNPTIDNIEAALKLYQDNKCQAIIACGGGSPMDCAKGVGARANNPKQTIPEMKGLLKVKHKIPLLIAIPTTAGTGSEVTVCAVVTNPTTHEKYAINDPKLIPAYAILDPTLLAGLPKNVTSTTGMDALTHAVEAYIGHSNTLKTKRKAINAIKLIHDNLITSFNDPNDLLARVNMQQAAYDAGVAFTRAYIGYVHAIAHSLGGFYQVPHGLANAIILPHVLKVYGSSCEKRLAKLADVIGLSSNTNNEDSRKTKAQAFIEWIENMNQMMNIPSFFENIIKEEDIPLMVKRADSEANPLYPVPKLLDQKELEKIYYVIMRKGE